MANYKVKVTRVQGIGRKTFKLNETCKATDFPEGIAELLVKDNKLTVILDAKEQAKKESAAKAAALKAAEKELEAAEKALDAAEKDAKKAKTDEEKATAKTAVEKAEKVYEAAQAKFDELK